jgi:AraC-like DNA-binding protein
MALEKLPGAWIMEVYRRGGVDLDELTKRLPDDVNLMLYEMDTILPDSINRLFNACVDISGQQDFGLLMNERVDISMYGLLGYLLFNSGTVKDLLETLERYHSVHHDGGIYYKVCVDRRPASIQFCYDRPEHFSHRHTTEWGLGFIPHFLKTPLGELAQPLSAQFSYDAPFELQNLHAYFGPNLKFNQPRNQLTYPRSILDRRITDVNQGLLKILREQADDYLLNLKKDNTLQKQIEVILYENLSRNRTNASDIAQMLNLSLSTFKRKMSKQGIDFKKTKDAIRNKLARQLLSQSTVQVHDIAHKIGFSNSGSFTRFFSRCNALKPLEYRKKFSNQEDYPSP